MHHFNSRFKKAVSILNKFKTTVLLVCVLSVFSLAATAQNFTVTSNGDTHAVSPTTSALDAGGQVTLRSACEASTQIAGTHTITIPGSITNISLTLGQITVGSAAVGNNITINGPGKAVLTITQTTANRVFITGVNAVATSFNDFTLNYAGPAGSIGLGGGAILAGGPGAVTSLTNVAINNFNIQFGNGGALSCGASSGTNPLTLTNCDFNNNTCGGGGGAVSYNGLSNCIITNCNFINNKTAVVGANTGGGGGALSTTGSGNGGTYTVTNCLFSGNQCTTNTGQGGAIINTNGSLNVSFCRFINNSAFVPAQGNVIAQTGGASVQTTTSNNNWWGVNSGPAANDQVVLAAGGTITSTKWLQLKTTISVNPLCTGGAATVTASFLSNSAAEAVTVANISKLIGLPISFANPTLGSLSGAQATIQSGGTATVTFTAGGTSGTGSVNAVVDNIPNNDVAPAKVSFTINPGVAVTGNPSNTSVCAGANASFTASFSGTPTPTLQWQVSTNGGGVYNNIAGATSSPLTFATVAGDNGKLYRAVGTNTCGSATTTGALLTVNTAPAVTGNPSNQSVPAGSNASFTASFSGSPTPTIQWQVSTNGGGVYNNISGATSSPLTFTTNLSQSGNLYRCVGTNVCSSVNTTGALLTVTNACATSSVISVSGPSTICSGSANIKVTITGGASPFTVVYNNGTSNVSVPGYTSGSNIPVSPSTTTSYTLVSVTDANLCVGSGNSGTATITVNAAPIVTTNPADAGGCFGVDVPFTAAFSGTPTPTIQWQMLTTDVGAIFTDMPGETSSTLLFVASAPAMGYQFRAVGTNSCGTATTTAATITASGATNVASNPSNTSVTEGTTATFTATFSGGIATSTYRWQVSTNGGGIYNDVPGANSAAPLSFTASLSQSGNLYRMVGTNVCNTAATTGALLTVTPCSVTPGITNNSGSTVLTCSLTAISVTATGGVSYLWDGGATPNTAANSFSSPGTYHVMVTAAGGCSSEAQITITQTITPPTAGITNNTGTTALGCGITTISVTATGGVSYLWDGGATPNTAANSFSSPGTYHVIVTGANGCTAQAQITITTSSTLPAPGPFTGTVNVCVYVGTGTQLTYSVPNVPGATYNWVVPTTVNILNGQGTNSIVVTLSAGFVANANKQLRLTATNACGTSPMSIYYLLAQAPNTPAPITATGVNVCPIIGTANTYTYSITPVLGAASYAWTSQAGTTIINHPNGPGVNDTTITVSFLNGFTNSNIGVAAVNGCGTSNIRSITITANAPSAPSPISGPANACEYIAPNGTPATYSVTNEPGNAYSWTVPPDVLNLTGQGTSSISFTYPNGFVSGTVSVTATNGCGTGPARSLVITKLLPAALSAIDIIQTASCPDRIYTYSVVAIPANATSVQWTVPVAAGAILISGQGTPSITVSYPSNAVNGTVTATATSNCGSSAVRSTQVKLPVCVLGPPPPPFARGTENAAKTVAAESMQVNVYPNPAVTDFKLQVTTAGKEKITVKITDMQGRQLKQLVVLPYQTTTIGSDLGAGSYIVEVRQGTSVKTVKMIKF